MGRRSTGEQRKKRQSSRWQWRAYLLAVGRGGLAKLVNVVEDGVVLLVSSLETGTLTLSGAVGGGAKVLEAGLLAELVKLGVGGSR